MTSRLAAAGSTLRQVCANVAQPSQIPVEVSVVVADRCPARVREDTLPYCKLVNDVGPSGLSPFCHLLAHVFPE